MCVHPHTVEYDQCVREIAEYTREIASGRATAPTWLKRGMWLQQMSELAGAVRDYDRAEARAAELSLDELARLHNLRGVCYRRTLMSEQALRDLTRAVELRPERGLYWSNLGVARYFAGQIEPALADLNRSLELDDKNERTWETRAMCHQKLANHAQAVADFGRAFEIEGEALPLAYAQRAHSYLMLGCYDEAIADCDHGERLDSHEESFEIYRVRGVARYAQGDPDAALGDLSRAISLKSDFEELYLLRGLVYRALGDAAAAADDLTEYAKRHPTGAPQALAHIANMMHAFTPDENFIRESTRIYARGFVDGGIVLSASRRMPPADAA
ncbi:MAG: tetratricopeptide repeat protein [Chloroflexi bacterium]|nr:tetratricopeptide repeat protein [Chloroflexota bacterium]